jgi:hypothetical protein
MTSQFGTGKRRAKCFVIVTAVKLLQLAAVVKNAKHEGMSRVDPCFWGQYQGVPGDAEDMRPDMRPTPIGGKMFAHKIHHLLAQVVGCESSQPLLSHLVNELINNLLLTLTRCWIVSESVRPIIDTEQWRVGSGGKPVNQMLHIWRRSLRRESQAAAPLVDTARLSYSSQDA